MTDETILRNKYMEFQMLEQAINHLQQKKVTVEKQMVEFTSLKENLESILKTKVGSSMNTPIGSGIFLKSELKDNTSVLVNIGSNVVIEKPIKESSELVDKQLVELNKILTQLDGEIEESYQKLNTLNNELAEFSTKQEPHVHGPNCNH